MIRAIFPGTFDPIHYGTLTLPGVPPHLWTN